MYGRCDIWLVADIELLSSTYNGGPVIEGHVRAFGRRTGQNNHRESGFGRAYDGNKQPTPKFSGEYLLQL